jgi:hypothetical protein
MIHSPGICAPRVRVTQWVLTVPSVCSGLWRTSRASTMAKTTLVATMAHYGRSAELLRWARRDNEARVRYLLGYVAESPIGLVSLATRDLRARRRQTRRGGLWGADVQQTGPTHRASNDVGATRSDWPGVPTRQCRFSQWSRPPGTVSRMGTPGPAMVFPFFFYIFCFPFFFLFVDFKFKFKFCCEIHTYIKCTNSCLFI